MLLYLGSGLFLLAIVLISFMGDSQNNLAYEVFNNGEDKIYNSTYPLTLPIEQHYTRTYKILAIADLDTNSKLNKDGYKYSSFLLQGANS
jgi:hypothetical protein